MSSSQKIVILWCSAVRYNHLKICYTSFHLSPCYGLFIFLFIFLAISRDLLYNGLFSFDGSRAIHLVEPLLPLKLPPQTHRAIHILYGGTTVTTQTISTNTQSNPLMVEPLLPLKLSPQTHRGCCLSWMIMVTVLR